VNDSLGRRGRRSDAPPATAGAPVGSDEPRPALEVRHVSKQFAPPGKEPLLVLDDIDLTLQRNTFTSIVGPSGCGKSTLLRLLAGLEQPTAGEVLIEGQTHERSQISVGYVSQDDTLLPWLTVFANTALPLRFRRVGKDERRSRTMEALQMVGLDGFAGYYPHQLSGGMQKRCIIARALIYEPPILLLDEPFGPLDALTRLGLQQELLSIWERTHQTAVFVTHDIVEAVALSDRVLVMGRSPGCLRDDLDVDLARPRLVGEIPSSEEFDSIRRRVWGQLSPDLGLEPVSPPATARLAATHDADEEGA
jgi:NitT/TauT family transport system ATP-binding protein